MANHSSLASERLPTLDAIRGIAALLVVFSHCYATLPEVVRDQLDWYNSPGRILVLGRPAVILFFVLSGFVLSVSLKQRPETGYIVFLIRRFFRIYVPFAVVIVVSALLYLAIDPRPVPGVSSWFNRDNWSEPLTFQLLLNHLAMIGRPEDATLNGPMWSLIIEMRLSLLFPFLFWLLWTRRHLTTAFAVATAFCTEVLARKTGLGREPYFNISAVQAVTITLYFLPFFIFGIWIAQRRDQLCFWVQGAGNAARIVLWGTAIWLLSLARDVPNGIGASLLIVLVLASAGAGTVLTKPLPQWLGRISYSLYLTHVLVLSALVHLLHGVLPLTVILAMAVVLGLVVAHACHALLERPSMTLGRRVSMEADGWWQRRNRASLDRI